MTEQVALAVVRVSKARGARDDHYSLPAQETAIRAYSEREDLCVKHVFIEPGTSAYVTDIGKIPSLKTAVEMIERGEANVLIVHESSRLARTERLTGEVIDRLTAVGARLINVSMGGLDYTTPEGRMILANEAALNSYWSRKTGQHSRKGKRQQFEEGLPIGPIPFGFTHARVENADGTTVTTRKLPPVQIPEEAGAISRAFESKTLGVNPHQIARTWNEAKYTVRSTKGLTYWQPQTIRDILKNRFYAGFVRHGDEYRRGLHEPIVSEELYWAAQQPVMKIVRRKHPPQLLRGVATCIEGHRLYVLPAVNDRRKNDFIHYYYREPSSDKERSCSQAGKLLSTKGPDAKVEAVLRTLALDGSWLEYVENRAGLGTPQPVAVSRADIEESLDRIQDEYIAKRMSEQKYQRLLLEYQAKLGRLSPKPAQLTTLRDRISSWWELWAAASPDTRNETCRLIFESAVIDFELKELTLKPWPEFEPLFDARALYATQGRPGRGRS